MGKSMWRLPELAFASRIQKPGFNFFTLDNVIVVKDLRLF